MIRISSIFLSCILFFSIRAEKVFTFHSIKECEALSALLPFTVNDLSYESDVTLSSAEFSYLVGFKKREQITAEQLKKAMTLFFQKNMFERIDLVIDGEDEKTIHFIFHGFWRFEKLKVTGVWVGKEWYKQQYLMQPGDRFEEEQHEHAIQHISDVCKKDGYFNISLDCYCQRNQKNKTVTVHAAISRGKRFTIGRMQLLLDADERFSRADRSVLQKELNSKFFRHCKRTKYNKKQLDEQAKAIKQFLMQHGFLYVSIDLEETVFKDAGVVDLKWRINVRKKRAFRFFGNHFFTEAELLEQIMKFGRSAWIVPASILTHEIKQAYNCNGFWQVQIDAQDEQDRSFFSIQEGMRAQLHAVKFEGMHAFSERQITKRIFAKLLRKRSTDSALVEKAYDQLMDRYLKVGYLDCKIEPPRWISLSDPGAYALQLCIHEGERQVITQLSIPGYEQLEKEGPFARYAELKKPIAYDAAIIAEQKRWLTDYFHKQGYIAAMIKHELVQRDGDSILMWHIERHEKIRFGKTIVQGSEIAPEKIMPHLAYQEGEVWDQEKIRQSFMRLKELTLFDTISFVPLPLLQDDTSRSLLLKLHNDDPFELRIRAGLEFQHIRQYQTFAGVTYKIGSTFMVKNPSNNGDLFRFDADVARSHREVNFKYQYPRMFRSPLDGIFHTYAIKYEQPGFIGSKRNLYTLYQHGFLVGVRHKNSFLDLGCNLGFEMGRTTFNDDDIGSRAAALQLADAIDFNPRLLNQTIPYLFVEPTILIDLLDNNLYPTHGSFSLFSCKGMFPTNERFSDAYFVKLLIEHSFFFPIKRVVGAVRFRLGHIFHRAFCDIMPNERFYLGGSHSIRSYETDLAPPIGIFVDDACKEHLVPRGGKTMLNLNAELRLPVARKMSGVLFQDVGLLCGDRFGDFCVDNIAAGTGFGIRYHTPIGPLRFDIGWKWKKCSKLERSFNWVLTFGNAF